MLGSALISQYWGGLAPCELCLLQRWPWAVAIIISLIAITVGSRSALPWAALALAAIFALWYRAERTLSIHDIVTRNRELFYWAAILCTFALGTAAGDLAATC